MEDQKSSNTGSSIGACALGKPVSCKGQAVPLLSYIREAPFIRHETAIHLMPIDTLNPQGLAGLPPQCIDSCY